MSRKQSCISAQSCAALLLSFKVDNAVNADMDTASELHRVYLPKGYRQT